MGNIKIMRGAFGTKLELKDASVVAGFPSPADDYTHETLDFWNNFDNLQKAKDNQIKHV